MELPYENGRVILNNLATKWAIGQVEKLKYDRKF
jgi:hypothetical protein